MLGGPDSKTALTSGQWMTEHPGGSAISQPETVAMLQTPTKDGSTPFTATPYRLDVFKWFSWATDSEVSVAPARTGPLSQSSQGLSVILSPFTSPYHPSSVSRFDI